MKRILAILIGLMVVSSAQAQVVNGATPISISGGVDCMNNPIPPQLPYTITVSGSTTTITVNGGLNWTNTITVSGSTTTVTGWIPSTGCH